MADTKISALTAGAPALTTDMFPARRAGANVSLLVSDLTGIGAPVASGTAGRILYVGTGPVLADSANLTFNPTGSLLTLGADVVVSRYGVKQVMISGDGTGATTNAGWIIGHGGSSGYSALWMSNISYTGGGLPSGVTGYTSAVIFSDTNNLFIQAPSASGILRFGNTTAGGAQVTKMQLAGTAGLGLSITAGIAVTDVAALSITQTWNNAACATGIKFVLTDTTSAAGALAFQILGGAAGATNLIKVTKAGLVDAPAYSVAGAAGASFGPGGVTSITVVNGIVTAIS